jgi:hypothetical protein
VQRAASGRGMSTRTHCPVHGCVEEGAAVRFGLISPFLPRTPPRRDALELPASRSWYCTSNCHRTGWYPLSCRGSLPAAMPRYRSVLSLNSDVRSGRSRRLSSFGHRSRSAPFFSGHQVRQQSTARPQPPLPFGYSLRPARFSSGHQELLWRRRTARPAPSRRLASLPRPRSAPM